MKTLRNGAYIYSGLKTVISLDVLQDYLINEGLSNESDITTVQAYERVPWLYRAVDVRAKSISAMPLVFRRGAQDVTESIPPGQITQLRSLLYLTETSLCTTAAAYWLKEKNILGMNLTPRFVLPSTIEPQRTREQGLTGFKRDIGGPPILYPVDRVVYFWLPSMRVELGPGTAPASVALKAAGVLYNLDIFAEGFFKRGAIKATLLSVDGNPEQGELDKLEAWWKRLIGGVKRAWQTIAIRANVHPIVIGADVEESAATQLTAQKREDIATALGVPQTILWSNAANYATARQDVLGFYQHTINPECDLIANVLNEQLYVEQGLELVFQPEQLDVMQEDEAARAVSLGQLTTAGLPLDLAMEILGYDLTDEQWERVREEAKPKPIPAALVPFTGGTQPAQPPQQEETEPGPTAVTKAMTADLHRWARKSEKRGRVADFDSAAILPGVKALIQEADSPEMAFSFLKAIDEARLASERRLQREIAAELARQWDIAAAAVNSGGGWDAAAFQAAMQNTVDDVLVGIMQEEFLRNAAAVGIDFDVAVVNKAAWEWARRYSYELVTGLTATTRDVISDATAKFISTPGMTVGELRGLLEPGFGATRAAMIGTTEVTRAYTQATATYQTMLDDAGITMRRVWHTSSDEKVCPACGPLDGKPESAWGEDEPPVHVNCRCWTTLEYMGRKK